MTVTTEVVTPFVLMLIGFQSKVIIAKERLIIPGYVDSETVLPRFDRTSVVKLLG